VTEKAASAFRTIGELSQEIGVRQHILRYWETRFPQLRPLQRAGGRRYYRPEDVALVRRIHALLEQDGYTIRGVQSVLGRERTGRSAQHAPAQLLSATAAAPEATATATASGVASSAGDSASADLGRLIALRNQLAAALASTATA